MTSERRDYVQRLNQGKDTWDDVYHELLRFCRFLSQSEWEGNDLAQEAVLKGIQHYQGEASLPLLKTIAKHVWIDTIRKRKREVLSNSGEDLQEKVTENACMECIEFLTLLLTPKQAVIFTLKEGFLYKSGEIADLLHTAETAVKSALHRANKRLKKHRENKDLSGFEHALWKDEEEMKLAELILQAVKNQDPEILIKAIPSIPSLAGELKTSGHSYAANRSISSPSCFLSMAA
jgi:DNA-directed RNA polymerase specialized sigma24 family protein